MKCLYAAIVMAFVAASFAFGQTVTYQGVTLKPGDVINFHEGPVVRFSKNLVSYGHSAMYLGMNPDTGKQSFLDFNVNNKGRRIPSEKEFLTSNAKYHSSFDVFRLKNLGQLNQQRLLESAKRVVQKKYYLGGQTKNRENCASAIGYVLSQASGRKIKLRSPDDFLGADFKKHPQLAGKSINVTAALREVKNRAASPAVVPSRPSVGQGPTARTLADLKREWAPHRAAIGVWNSRCSRLRLNTPEYFRNKGWCDKEKARLDELKRLFRARKKELTR